MSNVETYYLPSVYTECDHRDLNIHARANVRVP